MRLLHLIALLLMLWPVALLAQPAPTEEDAPAVLIADEVFITGDSELIARGNVEAFQGPVRLTAPEIRYNRETGALIVTGPITLEDGDGVTVVASAAELDANLRTGLLRSARMVLDQQLQLAAVQMQRVNDRYSQLYKTAVTSCRICEDGRAPLWQIRAKRVVHDKQERQLYFDSAQLLILDVPVFYLPRLRLPDPTLERATGFLRPEIRSTSQLGTGIIVPYFINIAPDRDLTLTPYLSGATRTLQFRYRQAFRKGRITVTGAVSRDDIRPGETRAYLFANGSFTLPRDFQLTFDIEASSDDAYLRNYDFSDKDRLDSAIFISRARRDQYIQGGLTVFSSLRDEDVNDELPSVVADAIYDQRFFPDLIGGELRFETRAQTDFRESDLDQVGRDVARIGLEADWLRSWILPVGLRADVQLGAAADLFRNDQDSTLERTTSQLTPRGALTLRYPLARTGAGGVTQSLEPVAQLGWVGGDRLDVPNEQSTRVEFDGGNLLSLSRFPGFDRRERGRALAFGVNWARFDPNGFDAALTLGQVIREDADEDFTLTSGLGGTRSDFLVAGQLAAEDDWILTARSLVGDGFEVNKAEVRGDYTGDRLRLGGSYVWLDDDPGEDRDDNIAELMLDGGYRINRYWTATADWRYDIAVKQASEVALGFSYQNECVSVGFSVEREYATSTSLEPDTTFGFTIQLKGFSARKGTETYTRTCG
ncbi:LPS assembly protein LptD [uncultured Roseobacter sp.]|uniref:LPS-assembly protein LptD n=1 Tax=uncultured Roseobacter sp. TaxID=114847 RepID=UPI00262B0C7F|nr:LPS assembly protein LptD [uncultured Roseobacter sp.]